VRAQFSRDTDTSVIPASRRWEWSSAGSKEGPLASEDVLEVRVRRHVFTSERHFTEIMDGIYGGISQPDIGTLFRELAASTSYEQFSSLVRQAQGSAGLMRFLELKLDSALRPGAAPGAAWFGSSPVTRSRWAK
jgi:hypothetical protein